MSPTASLSLQMYRLSDWIARNPTASKAIMVGLALTVAAAALLFGHDITWACPKGGGGCPG
jgi:hypothetical protein